MEKIKNLPIGYLLLLAYFVIVLTGLSLDLSLPLILLILVFTQMGTCFLYGIKPYIKATKKLFSTK